ncbi:LuxR C-terminal-related transcriptional regulator [Pseudarthrobacter sp. J1763]|uniref:helix-turn-helix transcriptional regulator n=1 Tax=Pseudarthrobacter sp. J1763 TaxID=3420445 RepID=UPI003D2C3A29
MDLRHVQGTIPIGMIPTSLPTLGMADRRQWTSLARKAALEQTIQTLSISDEHFGVVIRGGPGMGKSVFARTLATELSGTTHVVHLSGADSRWLPHFSQVSHLLARLPDASDSHRDVVAALAHMILSDAAGSPVLLIVEDVQDMDDLSTAVVMRLLLGGSAKLVACVQELAHLPLDLVDLYKDGLLQELKFAPLESDEISALLSAVLGAPVSRTAITIFSHASGGSPLALQAMVVEQLNCNNLYLAGAVWVLRAPVIAHPDGPLDELVRSRLAEEPEDVREALEWLSLRRRAPVSDLLKLVGPATVSVMERSGLLSIVDDGRAWVTLYEPYIGVAIRGWMDSWQRRSLYSKVSNVLAGISESATPAELMSFAEWTLECGESLSSRFALKAAQAANSLFHPTLAIACTEQITQKNPEWLGAALERARAYGTLGDYRGAVIALDEVSRERLDSAPPLAYGRHVLDLCSALLEIDGGYARVDSALMAAETRLGDPADPRNGGDSRARDQALLMIRLAKLQYLVHRGGLAQAVPLLEEGFQKHGTSDFGLGCASLLAYCWTIVGREIDGVALANDIKARVNASDLPPYVRRWRENAVYTGLLWSGEWTECLDGLKTFMDSQSTLTFERGGETELALGLVYTYAGRIDRAIDVLRAANALLAEGVRGSSYGLSLSALAFAYAQAGDVREARSFLEQASLQTEPKGWLAQWTAGFCVQMARRWLRDPGAKQLLIDSANEDITAGRMVTASMSLFGATVQGSDAELALLQSVSTQRQGRMARVNALVAEGSRHKDAGALMRAAGIAAELRLDVVESRCVVLALDVALASGDTTTAKQAQRRLDALTPRLPGLPLSPHSQGPELTERERQVARLAAQGMSNKEVATHLEVSIRTVEGHLYQVFTKLGITSRSGLGDAGNW